MRQSARPEARCKMKRIGFTRAGHRQDECKISERQQHPPACIHCNVLVATFFLHPYTHSSQGSYGLIRFCLTWIGNESGHREHITWRSSVYIWPSRFTAMRCCTPRWLCNSVATPLCHDNQQHFKLQGSAIYARHQLWLDLQPPLSIRRLWEWDRTQSGSCIASTEASTCQCRPVIWDHHLR